VNRRRQRAGRNEERRRSRRGRRQRQQEERLRRGVAAEIGASAYLAVTVGEEGDGHAVGERDSNVTGDGAAEARYRLGDAALVESNMNAWATLPPLSDGAGT